MASIKDVAAEAGVSTATVSRVLSNKPYISQAVRVKVLAAVEKLGYRPNQVARSLRSQQSNIIGLIVSDICNPFFTDVSRVVEDRAYDKGYSIFLCNSDGDEKKEQIYLREMVDKNVAGVIMSPTTKTHQVISKLPMKLSIVVYDRTIPGSEFDSILIDNVDASYQMTRHLIENGYRKLAGIFNKETTGTQRRAGFEKAISETGLESPRVVITQPSIQAGYAAAVDLLNSSSRPDAIFATDNLVMTGVMKSILEYGLKIPTDVGLVGFDDVTWMTLVQPGLTVVRQPTEEIGRMAVDLMIRRILEPTRPAVQVILKGELVIRGSSAPR